VVAQVIGSNSTCESLRPCNSNARDSTTGRRTCVWRPSYRRRFLRYACSTSSPGWKCGPLEPPRQGAGHRPDCQRARPASPIGPVRHVSHEGQDLDWIASRRYDASRQDR
jgi:hypothetical protein